MHLVSKGLLAAVLCAGVSGTAMAQQPPPTSRYRDGTGNSEIDRLNSSQLDQNYRGPYYQVPPDRVRGAYPPAYRPRPPGYVHPGYAHPGYGRPGYGPPAYGPPPPPPPLPPRY